ncbi:hypothetical protein HanXRQr2_Chr09g0364261 [Helianthus annuus]|uniref:Uncharacterized protein n=1 Tax=Helianthus annuus TaxID=4232 RepID=A0A9K3I2I4_HELAN|nr:hypothetical protein HanXRQr2_Chr09g0364261 [Helianthus annuus]KAJ0524483.1 hypothetical protein HanHA300_Chr09g0300951 [Helianthus annuus]KAJ0532085.1 hypothetical protein HanIR_Chr09g0392841 [Helianthus annuus]KAJ0891252.1 hypothetical protein HanPSC8_Chr09g0351451 [Helianthus annuus]
MVRVWFYGKKVTNSSLEVIELGSNNVSDVSNEDLRPWGVGVVPTPSLFVALVPHRPPLPCRGANSITKTVEMSHLIVGSPQRDSPPPNVTCRLNGG